MPQVGGGKGNIVVGNADPVVIPGRLPRDPKPIQPVQKPMGEVPDKRPFRLGIYEIIEEKDDYVVAKGYDPNAYMEEHTPAAHRTINVAKPSLLMRTPWENTQVTIGDRVYTYEYSDEEFGKRTARWTDQQTGETGEEDQKIDSPYFPGDFIVAVKVAKNKVIDGIDLDSEPETGLPGFGGDFASQSAGGESRLKWVDLNFSGRHWAGPTQNEAMLTVQEEKDDYLLCSGTDPDSGETLSDLPVAKPYLLQRTPWDGQTVDVDGKSVTYQYTTIGERTATATVDDEEIEETQKITPDYFPGDVIIARRMTILDPMEDEHQEPVEQGEQPTIKWVDVTGVRVWAVALDEEE